MVKEALDAQKKKLKENYSAPATPLVGGEGLAVPSPRTPSIALGPSGLDRLFYPTRKLVSSDAVSFDRFKQFFTSQQNPNQIFYCRNKSGPCRSKKEIVALGSKDVADAGAHMVFCGGGGTNLKLRH